MPRSISGKRSQIASLISRDLKRKHTAKMYQTGAGVLRERMGVRGRANVAEIRREGAMEREVAGQEGATYRKNIAVAADKYIQSMRGKQALDVAEKRTERAVGVQEQRSTLAEDLLERQIEANKAAAVEEEYATARSNREALDQAMGISRTDEYVYGVDPSTGVALLPGQKKKKPTVNYEEDSIRF